MTVIEHERILVNANLGKNIWPWKMCCKYTSTVLHYLTQSKYLIQFGPVLSGIMRTVFGGGGPGGGGYEEGNCVFIVIFDNSYFLN